MLRLLVLLLLGAGLGASAEDMSSRAGWQVHRSALGFGDLVDATRAAVKAEGLIVVTQAGPTAAAKRRGIEIPGNRVIGVFNNDYAVRVLALSTAAMIEAPIRLYVTENADGTATLSYKEPSLVFAPYVPDAGDALAEIAKDLDARFLAIARAAVQ